MNFLKKLTPFTLPFLLAACGNDDLDTNSLKSPDVYEFASRTNSSTPSSVDNKEVTTRLILIKELDYLIGSGHLQSIGQSVGKQGVIDLLNRIYEGGSSSLKTSNLYDSSTTATPINGITTELDTLQTDFSSLPSGVNLQSKMPGANSDLIYRDSEDSALGNLIGWGITGILYKDEDELSDHMIQAWFTSIANLVIDNPDTTIYRSNALDYQALVTSFLSTSLPYFQVTKLLLNQEEGLKASNVSEEQYTDLQHNWDLAFAYFGASDHYKLNSKLVNATANGLDNNGDERIDLFSEYNFIHAKTAANLDNTTILADTNFSQIIMQAFLDGRQLIDEHITTGDNELLSQANNQASIICKNWERAIAAQLIHHLNLSSQYISYFGQTSFLDAAYAKNWAYAKTYAIALQFNPNSIITFDELTEIESGSIHALITQTPETRAGNLNSYRIKLLTARDKIASIYNFSETNTLNW